MKKKPTRKAPPPASGMKFGKRPPPPELLDRVLAAVEKHGTPAAAVEALKAEGITIGLRTVYEWREKRATDPAWGAPPIVSPDALAAPTEKKPDPPPPAPPVVVRPPEGLSPRARHRWYIERQIDDIREALALLQQKVTAGDASALTRMAPLNGALEKWLGKLADLSPAEDHNPEDDAAKRWATAAESARKKIADGCAEARERMGALLGRPFPYAADVGAGRPAALAP